MECKKKTTGKWKYGRNRIYNIDLLKSLPPKEIPHHHRCCHHCCSFIHIGRHFFKLVSYKNSEGKKRTFHSSIRWMKTHIYTYSQTNKIKVKMVKKNKKKIGLLACEYTTRISYIRVHISVHTSVNRYNKVKNNQPLMIDLCSHLSLQLLLSFFHIHLKFV